MQTKSVYVIYFSISGTKWLHVAFLTGCTEVYVVVMDGSFKLVYVVRRCMKISVKEVYTALNVREQNSFQLHSLSRGLWPWIWLRMCPRVPRPLL